MGHRTCVLGWLIIGVAGLALAGDAGANGPTSSRNHTAITVWASATPLAGAVGGTTYGGYAPPSGALISEQRDVEIGANGELRITGVASTIDAGSVQLRGVGDPNALIVNEQRFIPGATTPDEILARHVGDPIAVVTPKGDVTGILRAVDAQSLVIEVGAGDARRLQVLRRDGYVQDVRMPAGNSVDQPSLAWRVTVRKPGKQAVELSYRADGMSWSADYVAVLDEAAKALDFSAWATVKNATGAAFDNAELTLVSAGTSAAGNTAGLGPAAAAAHGAVAPSRFTVATPVHLGNSESVQVELVPPRLAVKARTVVTYESILDQSASFQAYPATDCSLPTPNANSHAEVALEIDLPSAAPLPDGRVRLFKRTARAATQLEVISEDQLHSAVHVARIRLAPDSEITGERSRISCVADEHTRTIREKVEVSLDNKGKQPVEAIVREFLWRYPVWRIDAADETVKGVRGGAQIQEYRLALPAGAKKSVTYTVVYSW